MELDNSNLLPCPLCGCEVDFFGDLDMVNDYEYTINCFICNLNKTFYDKEKGIKSWNTRK